MRKFFLLLSVFLIFSLLISGCSPKKDTTPPQQVWQKTYGGSNDEWARSIQQTTDGGYIVAGGTYSFGAGGDFYIIKTDSEGNTGPYPTQ